jgi:hypothetical protein
VWSRGSEVGETEATKGAKMIVGWMDAVEEEVGCEVTNGTGWTYV